MTAKMTKALLATILIAAPLPALAADRTAPAAPMGNPGEWITQEDYPADSLAWSEQGIVAIRYEISETGAVENCVVAESSGAPRLDQAACTAIVAHGKFTPALNKKGKPVRSTGERRVRWQLPSAVPTSLQ